MRHFLFEREFSLSCKLPAGILMLDMVCSICIISLKICGCVGLFQNSQIHRSIYVSAFLYLHINKPHKYTLAPQQPANPATPTENGLGLISNNSAKQGLPTSSYSNLWWCTLFKDMFGEAVLLQVFPQHQFLTHIFTYQLLHRTTEWFGLEETLKTTMGRDTFH